MKKVLIFEGIAATGKTTLENSLISARPSEEVGFVSEAETLMPLIDNKNCDVAVAHLEKLLERIAGSPQDAVIIDRFHLTHAFRTNSSIDRFSKIESLLLNYDTKMVLLVVDEKKLESRIKDADSRRGDAWGQGKKGSIEERVAYYSRQQKKLVRLAASSKLKVVTIDTTQQRWDDYTDQLLAELFT